MRGHRAQGNTAQEFDAECAVLPNLFPEAMRLLRSSDSELVKNNESS